MVTERAGGSLQSTVGSRPPQPASGAVPEAGSCWLITMFRDAKGTSLNGVSVEAISRFHPKGVSQDRTLEALNFAHNAADKRVAHLTLGGSEKEDCLELCQIAAMVIHTATGHYL